jgi:hypothetical protein
MEVDAELLAAARAAQARVVEAERAVDLARAEFRYSVRELHFAGASLRELGDALNLSHQRVHQLVEEAEGGRRGWRSVAGRGDRPRRSELTCSFCGKSQKETRKLIAGAGATICDTCADKAGRVLATGEVAATPLSSIKPVPLPADTDAPAEPYGQAEPGGQAAARCSFCGKGRHRVDGLAMAAGTTTTESIRTRTEFGYAAASGPRLPWVSICSECVARCHEIVRDT